MKHEPKTSGIRVEGKEYFHLTCSQFAEGNCGYSVVHEFFKLDEWLEHFRKFHEQKDSDRGQS